MDGQIQRAGGPSFATDADELVIEGGDAGEWYFNGPQTVGAVYSSPFFTATRGYSASLSLSLSLSRSLALSLSLSRSLALALSAHLLGAVGIAQRQRQRTQQSKGLVVSSSGREGKMLQTPRCL